MPCYSPLRGVLVSAPEGRRLSFSRSERGKAVSIPCGRCIGCRLERARQWAVRIMHESKMHAENSFITLTYSPENVPKDGSLNVRDPQLFLKRLRERIAPARIKFFLAGEYGERLGRPHYHAIIFGYGFPDKVFWKKDREFTLYTSPMLSAAWGLGFASVGAVSFDSACYVANYATKKIVGSKEVVDAHYQGRKPEFLLMSRKPGIGASWYSKFAGDVFPRDEVVVKGVSARPPRYYSERVRVADPALYERLVAKREAFSSQLEEMVLSSGDVVHVAPSANARRLAVREVVAKAKLSLKRRNLGE